jgi:hypothetical protein
LAIENHVLDCNIEVSYILFIVYEGSFSETEFSANTMNEGNIRVALFLASAGPCGSHYISPL